MNGMNKRGISSVLTVAFIILGTVIGAALLWVFIVKSTDRSGEVVDPDCLTINLEPVSCDAYGLCGYGDGTGHYEANILVRRSVGPGNITALRFIFEDINGIRKVYDRDLISSTKSLNELETASFVQPYQIPVPVAQPKLVKIAALIGAKKDVCPVASSYKNCNILNVPPPTGALSSPPPTSSYPSNPREGLCCQWPHNYSECYNGGDSRYPINPSTGLLTPGTPIPPRNITLCCLRNPLVP